MTRHIKKKKHNRQGISFWDFEYTNAKHELGEVSEDLEKFTRWLERETKRKVLNPTSSVIDFGCGNGQNLLYLAGSYGMHGIGIDYSGAAIKEANKLAAQEEAHLKYEIRNISGLHLDIPNNSQTLALDIMSSHFLNKKDRRVLRDEIYRILKPGGYLFMKTFLQDEGAYSRRLQKQQQDTEEKTHTHSAIGIQEYLYTKNVLTEFLEEKFVIHKIYTSHKNKFKGTGNKRRTVSVYAQKCVYTS